MSSLILQFPFSAKSAGTQNLPPTKQKKSDRKYLTEMEVEKAIAAIKEYGQHGDRNAVAIFMAYRYGLRCSELIHLQWHQINFDAATIEIVRHKKGEVVTYPLDGRELRTLRKLQREYGGVYVFQSESGSPLSSRQFHRIVQTAGRLAKLPIKTHPHQLRPGCRNYLANKNIATRTIQDYLGHRKIEKAAIYIAANSKHYPYLLK